MSIVGTKGYIDPWAVPKSMIPVEFTGELTIVEDSGGSFYTVTNHCGNKILVKTNHFIEAATLPFKVGDRVEITKASIVGDISEIVVGENCFYYWVNNRMKCIASDLTLVTKGLFSPGDKVYLDIPFLELETYCNAITHNQQVVTIVRHFNSTYTIKEERFEILERHLKPIAQHVAEAEKSAEQDSEEIRINVNHKHINLNFEL